MSVQTLIAHYLRENGYHETLSVFEKEHGTLLETELLHGETLQEIIADRQLYHQTKPQDAVFEDKKVKTKKAQIFRNWAVPYAQNAKDILSPEHLVVDCAILETDRRYALLATSNKSLLVADLESGKAVFEAKNIIGNVIRHILVHGDHVFLCGMNGKLTAGTLDFKNQNFIRSFEHQIHPRLVSGLKIVDWRQKVYLVSMGWDFMVRVFLVNDGIHLKAEFKLSNQGQCMEALVHNDKLYVLVCKKEVTLMDVLCFDSTLDLKFRIALNDAEFSAVGFTPMSISVLGSERPLIAIATSHEPYMRAIVVELNEDIDDGPEKIKRQQIVTNLNTLSPQDKFSEAKLHWRTDGSGLWIAGEDGTIRGLDLLEEKVVVSMEAHEGRMKSLCFLKDAFLTCGIDKTVKFWQ